MTEKIAIVLATYNPNLEYFQKQIQSIKNQSWQNWICHLVDDCSKPEYQAEIQNIIRNDGRFICHFHEQNLQHYHNFERGLQYCTQDPTITAIAFADQDDVWTVDKLTISLEKLRSQQALLVHSDLQLIDGEDKIINASAWDFEGRKPEKVTPELLLLRNVVTGCSLLFCSSLLPHILPFPPQTTIGWHHDWWVALIAAQRGNIAHIRQPLLYYRLHGANTVGLMTDYGKLYRELIVWCQKKFPITNNSYLIHSHLSQAFQAREQLDTNWFNPFDEQRLDFGVGIINLCYKSMKVGYGSEGIGLRIWFGKVLFDLNRVRQRLSQILNKFSVKQQNISK
ncbi:MAG: glycosyltransferase family 2 protein [Calothrix sp. MO_167.B42]|nr:glycosyltransferase family 2 protein [Calothrix sp. MO_167.B42]